MQTVDVGLIGLGTVGTGVAKLLLESNDDICRRSGVQLRLKRIAEKDWTGERGLEVPPEVVAHDAGDVIDDPSISIVIELVGGLEPAKSFIDRSLKAGKAVVTANKALLAHHGPELFKTAQANGTCVAFEASVGGGIPIIATTRDSFIANHIQSVSGIVNGTCNYILTQMTKEGTPYEEALGEAQQLGYAEQDPTFDVDGIDSAHKLAVLARLAFGQDFDLEEVYCEGISKVEVADIGYAGSMGYVLKLLAIAKTHNEGLELRVHPTLLREDRPLAAVSGVFNAIYVEGAAVGQAMLYGRGAGQMPTASAVVADVVDVALGRALTTFQTTWMASEARPRANVLPMDQIQSRYYVRMIVADRPGVLAQIAGIFGTHAISIASVNQHEGEEGGYVPIVLTTHLAEEGNMQRALNEVEVLESTKGKARLLRVEG